MTKILLIILIAALGASFYFGQRFFHSTPSTDTSGLEQRVTKLEQYTNTIVGQINTISTQSANLKVAALSPLTNSSNLDQRVSTLEQSLNDLSSRVTKLEQSSTSQTAPAPAVTATPATPKAPLYIPLGSSGSGSGTTYSSVSSMQATINASDYPGYTSMQFEVSLSIFQNGTAYAQIFNSTDGTVPLPSQVSTTSTDYVDLLSGGFNLPSGKKTYTVQLRSDTGYQINAQNARIKVNF